MRLKTKTSKNNLHTESKAILNNQNYIKGDNLEKKFKILFQFFHIIKSLFMSSLLVIIFFMIISLINNTGLIIGKGSFELFNSGYIYTNISYFYYYIIFFVIFIISILYNLTSLNKHTKTLYYDLFIIGFTNIFYFFSFVFIFLGLSVYLLNSLDIFYKNIYYLYLFLLFSNIINVFFLEFNYKILIKKPYKGYYSIYEIIKKHNFIIKNHK